MKKLSKYIMAIWIITWIIGSFWICIWQRVEFQGTELSKENQYQPPSITEDHTELSDQVSIDEKDGTIIINLLEVFWLDKERGRDHKFIDYAKAIMNMALWLISFIALIMTIYTFYMMFFSENEAGIKKAKWNLFGIFIALAIIWLAWLIVSIIFRWYEKNWREKEDFIQSNNVSMNIYYEDPSNNNVYLVI